MRVFQSKVGKALVDEQLVGKGVNYAKVPAQSIPDKAFKTREDFKAVVDAFGGNENLARQLGQRYFASKLEGIKDAKGIEKFIRDNRTMLRETDFLRSAEKYAMDVRRAETRGAKATERGAARTITAKEQRALQQDLNRLGSDLERAKDINEISSQASKVADRLEKSGVINLQQRDQMLREINSIADAQRKRQAVQKVIAWALGGGTLYGAYSGATSYLKD